jgi:hypothetical protein
MVVAERAGLFDLLGGEGWWAPADNLAAGSGDGQAVVGAAGDEVAVDVG